jgi:hypothetical protein
MSRAKQSAIGHDLEFTMSSVEAIYHYPLLAREYEY